MVTPRIRMTAAVTDVLDILMNASRDDPPWGLRFCELSGHGSGTIYPVLDRLMKAGWISDRWEDSPPSDRPRRRLYELTATGREQYLAWQREHTIRRRAWIGQSGGAGVIT